MRSSAGQRVLRIGERKTKSFVFPSKRRTDEINGSLTGQFQANRSDGIKPGIGIERKNIPTTTSAESFNEKIKAFRTALREVTDIKFFLFRLTKLYT